MSGRSALSVAVLGAGSPLGHQIVSALVDGAAVDGAAVDGARTVVCIGPRRRTIHGASWRIADLRDPALARKLAKIDTVVLAHLDGNLDAETSAASGTSTTAPVGAVTDAIVDALNASKVRHVVLLSNAMVVGGSPDNMVPMPEDAPARVHREEGVLAEWVHAEQRLAQWASAASGRTLTVLRTAAVVGPGIDTAISRHFETPRVVVVDEDRPVWSLVHVDDVASAVEAVVTARPAGTFAVAAQPPVPHGVLLAALGKRAVRVPSALAVGAADRLHRVGVTQAPADDLNFIRYPWVLDPVGLAALGWKPRLDSSAVLRALAEQVRGRTAIAGRRVARPDLASLGAAGAAAAVLGAAAIVRARRQRGT